MSEHDAQVALFDFLRLYEHLHPALPWVHAIPNGGLRNQKVAENMKAEGVKAGVWDIFVPFPAQGYNGFYIEMKWDKGRLTREQSQFLEYVIENCANYKMEVFSDWLAAAELIFEYLGIEFPVVNQF